MVDIALMVRPQALKGEIKVKMLADDVFFKNLKKVFNKTNKTEYKIKKIRIANNFAFLLLDGVSTIEEAEKLRGHIFCVEEGEVDLSGHILVDDLKNFDIVAEDGEVLGKLLSVENFGSADVFTGFRIGGKFSFPNVPTFVKEINIEKKQVVVVKEALEEEVVF